MWWFENLYWCQTIGRFWPLDAELSEVYCNTIPNHKSRRKVIIILLYTETWLFCSLLVIIGLYFNAFGRCNIPLWSSAYRISRGKLNSIWQRQLMWSVKWILVTPDFIVVSCIIPLVIDGKCVYCYISIIQYIRINYLR